MFSLDIITGIFVPWEIFKYTKDDDCLHFEN